jgi:hypothetical protein
MQTASRIVVFRGKSYLAKREMKRSYEERLQLQKTVTSMCGFLCSFRTSYRKPVQPSPTQPQSSMHCHVIQLVLLCERFLSFDFSATLFNFVISAKNNFQVYLGSDFGKVTTIIPQLAG